MILVLIEAPFVSVNCHGINTCKIAPIIIKAKNKPMIIKSETPRLSFVKCIISVSLKRAKKNKALTNNHKTILLIILCSNDAPQSLHCIGFTAYRFGIKPPGSIVLAELHTGHLFFIKLLMKHNAELSGQALFAWSELCSFLHSDLSDLLCYSSLITISSSRKSKQWAPTWT